MRATAFIRRGWRSQLLIGAVCVIGGASVVDAQRLNGSVRDSASQAPIPGAVVVLLDASGASVGRNITNERGEYLIAQHPSMRRLQVLRIGFRPRTLPIPESTTGVTRLDVVMVTIPTLLEAVAVVDQPNCPRSGDRPAAFALWEQAKAALLATIVAREANPAFVTRLHFVRRADRDDRIISQTVNIDSASTSRPFVASRTATEFVEQGFSYDSARVTWLNGPDAEVMLDDAFASGYCFTIAKPERDRPSQIGLGFAPANRKRGRVDIEGALWIDSSSRVLTDIVFRYVGGNPNAERLRPGGRTSFREMDNGTVMVDRWFLRTATNAPNERTVMRGRELMSGLLEARETGGEVAHARWPDGRNWHASLGTVRGKIAGHGGPGTEIRLVDTDYRVIADAAGTFEISNLLPGPYVIGTIDSTFAVLDLVIMTYSEFTAARDSVVALTVEVPTASDYAAALCEVDPGQLSDGVLVARVMLPDGTPAEGAQVEIRIVGQGNLRRVAGGATDKNGLFHMCRTPRNVTLQIRAQRDDALPALTTKATSSRITTVKLQLEPIK